MSEGSSAAVYIGDYLGWDDARLARGLARSRALYRALGVDDRLLALERATLVYVFSKWARDVNVRWGADPAKLRVLYPGFPDPGPVRRDGRDTFTFVFVGGDFERKGGFEVLEAIAALRCDHPYVRLVLAGSDPHQRNPDRLMQSWVSPGAPRPRTDAARRARTRRCRQASRLGRSGGAGRRLSRGRRVRHADARRGLRLHERRGAVARAAGHHLDGRPRRRDHRRRHDGRPRNARRRCGPARCDGAAGGRAGRRAPDGRRWARGVRRALHARALPRRARRPLRRSAARPDAPRADRRLLLPAAGRHRQPAPDGLRDAPAGVRLGAARGRPPRRCLLPRSRARVPRAARPADRVARAQQGRKAAAAHRRRRCQCGARRRSARARTRRRADAALPPRPADRMVSRTPSSQPVESCAARPYDAILSSSFPITAHLVARRARARRGSAVGRGLP